MRRELATDSEARALGVLAQTLSDERRAMRFLDLTGLSPEGIRARAGDPQLLAACIAFLEAHEPDLVAVADALEITPSAIVALREALER